MMSGFFTFDVENINGAILKRAIGRCSLKHCIDILEDANAMCVFLEMDKTRKLMMTCCCIAEPPGCESPQHLAPQH